MRGAATAGEDPAHTTDGIESILQLGGEPLRGAMLRTEEHLERVTSDSGLPLSGHAHATVSAGGKRLRPLLVMLAAHASGEDALDEGPSVIRAAVAVELVHSATLVHDDIIDDAGVRRGQPTVSAVAGRDAAVATGDLLFSRAFAELALNESIPQLRALSTASSALAEGELLQREDAYADQVPIERYLRRCELKTAALFEAACRMGALSAPGSPASLADDLGHFARRIGLAFQILDDVLDVSGPVERTGKAPGTDLLDGTVTLPLILAREHDATLSQVDLRGLRGAAEAQALCDRIASTGALEESRERAMEIVTNAKAALPAILPDGRAALLELVADAVVERYR